VAGQRQQIDPEFVDVQRHFASGLRGIGVQQDAALASQACDLGNRLQRAHLVVGVHHRDQGRVGPDRCGQLLGGDATEPVDGQHSQRPTLIAQVERRCHDRGMFDRADHQVALVRLQCARHTQQRQVVGLGRAARERDLLGPRADQCSHLFARPGNSLRGASTEGVGAGGIAVLATQPRQHGNQHLRRNRGGGVEVEIDRVRHVVDLLGTSACGAGLVAWQLPAGPAGQVARVN
jgi:hypothetical protein